MIDLDQDLCWACLSKEIRVQIYDRLTGEENQLCFDCLYDYIEVVISQGEERNE